MGFEILIKDSIQGQDFFFRPDEEFDLVIVYNQSETWKINRTTKDISDLQTALCQTLSPQQQDFFQIETLYSHGYIELQMLLNNMLLELNEQVWEVKPLLHFLNENKNLSFIDRFQFDRINAQLLNLTKRLDYYESNFKDLSKRVDTVTKFQVENKESSRLTNISQQKTLKLPPTLNSHAHDNTFSCLNSAGDDSSIITSFTSKESIPNSLSIPVSSATKDNEVFNKTCCSRSNSNEEQLELAIPDKEDIELEATIISVIQNKGVNPEKDWQVNLPCVRNTEAGGNDLDMELKHSDFERNMNGNGSRSIRSGFSNCEVDRAHSNNSSVTISEELGPYFGLDHNTNPTQSGMNNIETENIAVWATADEPKLSPNAIPFTPHGVRNNIYVAPFVKKTNYHSIDLYSIEHMFLNHENATNEIMEVIHPDDRLIKARTSMIRLLKKKFRKGFACNVFEIGLHAIRCFLPSDPIKLAVVINKKLAPYWHNTVEDILKKNSTESVANGIDLFPSENVTFLIIKNNEIKKTSKKVTFTSEPYDIEIYSNSRVDLCMLAFLEEVSTIVGHDNLFKRSILLIRAWWSYETVAYVGISIKHYLNDLTICIMVCAIFNQYHTRITSPLQALCLFLAEYSSYDGTTHVITLQGIVPYTIDPITSAFKATEIEPQEYHLISSVILEKYWNLFHLNQVLSLKKQVLSANNALAGCVTGSSSMSDINPGIEPSEFIRSGFEVFHPFDGSNMVTERLSARALALLSKALMSGAQNISLLIYQVSVEEVESHINLVNGFFPALLSHFADRFRHDAFGNITLISSIFGNNSKHLLNGSIDKLWQSVLYCNFIIESVISESAILTFCIDELSMFGPMVTDDLVERLGIISNTAKLIVTLNDKFGGLKKFLERFPDVFIFSDEHPSNPHVILRVALSNDLQGKVVNGILPANLCAKYIQKIGRKVNPLNSVTMSNAANSANRGLSPNNNNIIISVLGQTTTSSISSRNANSVNSSPNLTSIHSARSSISSIEKPSLQDINTPYNSYFSNQRVSGQQNQHTNSAVAITTSKAPANSSLQSSSRLALHDVEYQQGYFDSSSDSCIDDHQGLLSSLRENSTEYRDSLSQLPMPSAVPSSVSSSLHHLQFEELPPVASGCGGMPTTVSKKGYRSQEQQQQRGGYGSYFQNTSLNTTTTTSGLIPSNHNSINRDDFSVSSREYEQSLSGVSSSIPSPIVTYTDHPRSQLDYNKNREYDPYYSSNQSQRHPSGSNVDYNNIPPSTTTYPTTMTTIFSSQQYNGAQPGHSSQFDSRDNVATMYSGEQYSDRNKPRYFRNKRYDTSQQFK